MTETEEKMMDAYKRQEHIYQNILELVKKQKQLLENGSERECMARIVSLCEKVEKHLARIENIELEIQSEKQKFTDPEATLPQPLQNLLSRVATVIEDARSIQGEVREKLGQHIGLKPDKNTDGSQDTVQTRRAHQLYTAT